MQWRQRYDRKTLAFHFLFSNTHSMIFRSHSRVMSYWRFLIQLKQLPFAISARCVRLIIKPKQGACSQGQINHWANRANARGLALLGASRLNVKTLLCWFFMFSNSPTYLKLLGLSASFHFQANLVKLAFFDEPMFPNFTRCGTIYCMAGLLLLYFTDCYFVL